MDNENGRQRRTSGEEEAICDCDCECIWSFKTIYITSSQGYIPPRTSKIKAVASLTMPLYELFCIAAPVQSSGPFRDLVRTTARLVLDHGGAVRGMQFWGRRVLPQRCRRHQLWHTEGDHFLLQFDTNPRVLQTLSSRLQADPRVIKWTTLKLGERLEQITPKHAGGDIGLLSRSHPTHMGGGRTVLVHSPQGNSRN